MPPLTPSALGAARRRRDQHFANLAVQLPLLESLHRALVRRDPFTSGGGRSALSLDQDHQHDHSETSGRLKALVAALKAQYPRPANRPPAHSRRRPALLLFDGHKNPIFFFIQLPQGLPPDALPSAYIIDNERGDVATYSADIYEKVLEAIQAEQEQEEEEQVVEEVVDLSRRLRSSSNGSSNNNNNNIVSIFAHQARANSADVVESPNVGRGGRGGRGRGRGGRRVRGGRGRIIISASHGSVLEEHHYAKYQY